jgi:hypothetical protein
MELEKITESKHKELLALLNPLLDFMTKNNFNYFLVAGKEGTCTRHLSGEFDDVTGMIIGIMETNKQVRGMLEYCVNETKEAK